MGRVFFMFHCAILTYDPSSIHRHSLPSPHISRCRSLFWPVAYKVYHSSKIARKRFATFYSSVVVWFTHSRGNNNNSLVLALSETGAEKQSTTDIILFVLFHVLVVFLIMIVITYCCITLYENYAFSSQPSVRPDIKLS